MQKPDKEMASLHNASVPLAFHRIERQENRSAFCLAITTSGKREKFFPDATCLSDPDESASVVRQHIVDAIREKRYRAVAFVRIVKHGPTPGLHNLPCTEAIQITTDHEKGVSSTFYIPFNVFRGMVTEGYQAGGLGPAEEPFFVHDMQRKLSSDIGDLKNSACQDCRSGACFGVWPPPARIAEKKDENTFLHRCERCGAFWVFTPGFAKIIDEATARKDFLNVFST